MYQVPVFKGLEKVSNREKWREKKKKKKKKSLKTPVNLVSGTLEKLQKIHNKEYIYIYLHTNYIYKYIYIYSGTTRETEEGLKAGGRQGSLLPSTALL